MSPKSSPSDFRKTRPSILFITGTDTGVGKTVATALLLYHLRRSGVNALALKPFCSGGREDAEALQKIQGSALALDEINPFCFSLPLAPLVAARKERRRITLKEVLQKVRRVTPRCDCLLIEGAGGVLVPLGENFSLVDMIVRLRGDVLVVAPNKLGVINHVLLTLKALPLKARRRAKVVLMGQKTPDLSVESNAQMLAEKIGQRNVFCLPFMGCKILAHSNLQTKYKKFKKTLRVSLCAISSPQLFFGSRQKRK